MLAMDKHIQTMSIDERRVTTKLMKALENVPLENSNPEKFTRIGTSMEMKTKQDLPLSPYLKRVLLSNKIMLLKRKSRS